MKKDIALLILNISKKGKNWFLRIYIDKPGGVDLNDCAVFDELISQKIDSIEPDPIPYAYYLGGLSRSRGPLKTEDDLVSAVD